MRQREEKRRQAKEAAEEEKRRQEQEEANQITSSIWGRVLNRIAPTPFAKRGI